MVRRTLPQWQEFARNVVIDVLEQHHAVTHRELEARAADRVWNPQICPSAINPHHLTAAAADLINDGYVERTIATTRGGPGNAGLDVMTLSFSKSHKPRGRRAIDDAAARKRILTARHQGWSGRRGKSGLIGLAGETAMTIALFEAQQFARIQTNITELQGTKLIGEIDMSCVHVADDLNSILVLIEVKNTREWYYDIEATSTTDGAVNRFLRKAAHLQHNHAEHRIAPLFVCRRAHYTLIELGAQHGFLVASTRNQLVRSDSELTPEAFAEVRDDLGYADLQLDRDTTNFHRGIASKMIPKEVGRASELWGQHHTKYLHPGDI